MGKKGRMSHTLSDGDGKWKKTEVIRSLQSYIEEARSTSTYTQQCYKRMQENKALKSRKSLIFPHLQSLLWNRVHSDRRNPFPTETINYRIKNFSSEDDELCKEIENDKKLITTDILNARYRNENIDGKLSLLCLKSIGLHLDRYEIDDLVVALNTLSVDSIEILMAFSNLHNTLNASHFKLFAEFGVSCLIFNEHFCDDIVEDIIQAAHCHVRQSSFTPIESWEEVNWSSLDLFATNNTINEIYIFSSHISLLSLTKILKEFPSLIKLTFHRFNIDMWEVADDLTLFSNFLELMALHGQSIAVLEFRYCFFVNLDALQFFFGLIRERRLIRKEYLSSLKEIYIYGYKSLKAQHCGMASRNKIQQICEESMDLYDIQLVIH
eukprot:gene8234-11142_t